MHRGEKIPFASADLFSSRLFFPHLWCWSCTHTDFMDVLSHLFGLGLGLSLEQVSDGLSGDPCTEPRAVSYHIHSGKGQWHLFLELICMPGQISSLKLKLLKGQIKPAPDTVKPKGKFYMNST